MNKKSRFDRPEVDVHVTTSHWSILGAWFTHFDGRPVNFDWIVIKSPRWDLDRLRCAASTWTVWLVHRPVDQSADAHGKSRGALTRRSATPPSGRQSNARRRPSSRRRKFHGIFLGVGNISASDVAADPVAAGSCISDAISRRLDAFNQIKLNRIKRENRHNRLLIGW